MKTKHSINIVKKLLLAFSIIILAILILFLYIRFTDYKFYKSREFISLSFNLGLHLKTYFNSHCSYPATDEVFLEFLKRDNLFESNSGYKIDNKLFRNGIGLVYNKNDSSIVIVSYGRDRIMNEENRYLFSEKMNFIDYLFSNKDIYLTSVERYTCCYLFPNHLIVFKDGVPLKTNDQLHRVIARSFKEFTKKYFDGKLFWILPTNDNILYFKLRNSKNNILIESFCNDHIFDEHYLNQIIDTLTIYWDSINIKEGYDSLYFNFKVADDFYYKMKLQ